MKELDLYITEKLKLNKDTLSDDDMFSIEYISSVLTKEHQLITKIMEQALLKDNVEVENIETLGVLTCFKIYTHNREDFLWILCFIYGRVASEGIHIKDEFDKKMKTCIREYGRKYKKHIHELYTMDEITDAYLKFRKLNHMR